MRLALESDRAAQEREEAAVLAKNEQLRANLLRSIGHDLRTPLTAISGSAAILRKSDERLSLEQRCDLADAIYDDSLWLIDTVENLLAITRVEDGTIRLNLTSELIDEVIEPPSAMSPKHRMDMPSPSSTLTTSCWYASTSISSCRCLRISS